MKLFVLKACLSHDRESKNKSKLKTFCSWSRRACLHQAMPEKDLQYSVFENFAFNRKVTNARKTFSESIPYTCDEENWELRVLQLLYLLAEFPSKVVITRPWRTFERALVYKMAAFIQLANVSFVIFLVVERQTSTVIYTRAVAMNCVSRWGPVKNMVN